MIKDRIISTLNQYLGEYFENVDSENLKYSIFRGREIHQFTCSEISLSRTLHAYLAPLDVTTGNVELRDLVLKPESVVELLTLQLGTELPIEVKAGHVDYIKLSIPWSNLFGSTEVRLELSGLYILAGPITDRPYDKKKDEDLQNAIKQGKLKAFEESAIDQVKKEAEGNPTLFEKIGKYILNNIQISISNVHIRYEDSVTNGDYSFAVGAILRGLHLFSTDDKWQEAELDSNAQILHKLGQLTDLSVYWNHYVKDTDLVGKAERTKTDEWRRLMRESIGSYRIDEESFKPILKPVSAEAKLIMNNQEDFQMPKLYIQFSLQDIDCLFSRHQYLNLLKWFDAQNRMQVNRRYRKYRPNETVRNGIKSWWKYACKAIVEEVVRPCSWTYIVEYRMQFKKYKDLYKKHLEFPDDQALKTQLKDLEYIMDITNIIAAREDAKCEFAEEAPERAKRKKNEKQASGGGWLSWIWGSSEEEEEEIKIDEEKGLLSNLTEKEKKELFAGVGYDENANDVSMPKEYVAYKIQLRLKKCCATLMNYSKPILKVALCDMLTSYENRPGGEGIRVSSNTESFAIEGASVDYRLVSLLTSNGGIYTTDSQMFTLDYEIRPLSINADQSLKLNVRPVEIFYDEHAISQVLMFFQVPEDSPKVDINELAMQKLSGVIEYSRDALMYAINQQSTFHVSVHMRSPYVVIPEKGTLHSGGNIMIVDLGTLSVESELQDKEKSKNTAMTDTELHSKLYDKFLVKVTDVKVLIADSGDDWHLFQTKTNSKFHILPSTGLEIAFYKSVMPENYELPRQKFDARLQSLTVNLTDEQLLVLYTFVFHFPKPTVTAGISHTDGRSEAPHPRIDLSEVQLEPDLGLLRQMRRSILKRPVVSLYDIEEGVPSVPVEVPKIISMTSTETDMYFSASDDSEDEKDKWASFLSIKTVDDYLSPNIKMKMFVRIQLGELVLQLSLEQNKQQKNYLMFRLDRISADMAELMYVGDPVKGPSSCGVAFHASVGAIRMADKLHTGASGEYLELLKTESENELISISYRQIQPDCPDFADVYKSIENSAVLTFHNMGVMFDQTGICYLKKFVEQIQERIQEQEKEMETLSLPVSPPPVPIRRQESKVSSSLSKRLSLTKRLSSMVDEVNVKEKNIIKLHLITCVKDIRLRLCNIDTQFAEMEMRDLESQILAKSKRLTFSCRLKELAIYDLKPDTLYPNILVIEKEDDPFFDLRVEQFKDSNGNRRPSRRVRAEPALDFSVRLRVGHLQLAYINKFLWDVTKFFEPMKSPEITEAATVAMESMSKQVTEIHPTSLRIGLVVDMYIPTVIIPKHSKSPDLFFVKFGNLKIGNSFKKTVLENGQEQEWNDFTATLTEAQVSRGKLVGDQFTVLHHVVKPVNFKTSFSLALAPFKSKVMYDISGDLDLVQVNLSETDLKLITDVIHQNLAEGAPKSSPDIASPTTISPIDRPDSVDAPITNPEEGEGHPENNSYNAVVTLQGLVMCLYQGSESMLASSNTSMDIPILSRLDIGKFVARANTYAEGDDKMDVNISLHSMSIDDVRPDSNIANKRIFYCSGDSMATADNHDVPLPLISIIYKAKANDSQEADIRMEKVTLNVHIPYILALYNFYLASFGTDIQDMKSIMRQNSSSTTNSEVEVDAPDSPPPSQSSIKVYGTIKEPEIILFGDPDKQESRVLVFKADIEFDYQADASIQRIGSKVKEMKMYKSIYGSDSTTRQWVIEPCNVDFERSLDIVQNHTKYTANLPKLDIYISPSVLHLIKDVLLMLGSQEEKSTEEESTQEAPEKTNMWSIKPTSPEKWLEKIDESKNIVNPLRPRHPPSESLDLNIDEVNAYFRIRNRDHHVDLLHIYSSVDASLHDWSKQFHMTAEIKLKASYFNERLGVWEPLVEPVSEKEGNYRPWEAVIKVIQGRSYPMTFNYIQEGFNMEECLRNDVQQLLHNSKRRSSSSESESDESTEMTVLRPKLARKRSRIASDKSYESIGNQGSIQGESDTEPDGLIQSITNKLGGIFSDDSSEDADISDTDENDEAFDPSLDKPVFLTPKGPIQVSREHGYDEVDAPLGLDIAEGEADQEIDALPQSYYLIVASQDKLLLNVTPQAINVATDVMKAMTKPEAVEMDTVNLPAFEVNNQLGIHTSVIINPNIKVHEENVRNCSVIRKGHTNQDPEKISLDKSDDEKIDEGIGESQTDGILANHLGNIGHLALSAGAFVHHEEEVENYFTCGKINKNRMRLQVDGFDLSSVIPHKKACRQLMKLVPDKQDDTSGVLQHSTKYWYILDIDVWHGRKAINIMSPLLVKNSLTVPIDVFCKTEDLKQYKVDEITMETGPYTKLTTLGTEQQYNVPLFLAYHCDLFVCPSELQYRIHQRGIWWKDLQLTKEKAKTFTCPGNTNDKSFNIKVLCKDGCKLSPPQDVPKGVPYFVLIIRPPVMIHNYLPYDVQFSLEGSGAFSSLTHGESTPLYTIQLLQSYKLHLQMQDYLGCDWTGVFEVSQDLEEFKAVNMAAYDFGTEENTNKHLTLIVNAKHKMSLDLFIYSPYWLINKTDLPLQLRGSSSDAVYDFVPHSPSPVLFRFKKNRRKKAKIKVYQSRWSQSFSMDTVGNSGVVICHDKERQKKYRLMLQFQWSDLKLTRIVTVTPFFLVVNKSSHNLRYMEENEATDLWLDVKIDQCSPYWPSTNSDKMYVQYEDSKVTSEHFPINSLHVTVLRMENGTALCVEVCGGIETPRTITFTDYDIGDAPVRVENLCDDVFIMIHQKDQHQMTVLAKNQSILYTWDDPAGPRQLMWNVYGGSDKQDAEVDITKDGFYCKQLSVKYVQASGTYNYKDVVDGVDSSPEDDSEAFDEVDGTDTTTLLKTKRYKMTIYWVSFLEGQQRVILFTRDRRVEKAARMSHISGLNTEHDLGISPKMNEGEQASLLALLSLDGITVSVINEYLEEVALVSITSVPAMWEIEVKNKWKMLEDVTLVTWLEDKWVHGVQQATLEDRIEVDFKDLNNMRMTKPYMGDLRRICHPGLFFQYRQSKHQYFIHAKVYKIQIDNQLSDSYYQTVLNSVPTPAYIAKKQGSKPFFEFGAIRRTVPENHVDTFRQFQIILQEFNVQLDWGFIESMQDIFADLMPAEESESARLKSDIMLAQRPIHEIAEVMVSGRPNRIFFEMFKLSPVKMHVSFSLRGTPHLTRDVQPTAASDIKEFLRNSIGATFTDVKGIELKMGFFERRGVLLSSEQMMSQCIAHYRHQLIMQLYVVILGLDVLGNPYGLVKDISQGLGELFYEPILDTIQGEDEFSENIMRGFQSAMGHIVGGTANTVARITGSLGNAFAYLSMDEEFQKKRQRRLQQQPADLPHSFAMAGKGFLSGIKFGLSGIVLDPIQGANEDGVEGFFKGIGKGLLGLITQPIGGVLDLVSLSFDGVRRAAELEGGIVIRMRLPRFINRYKGLEPFSEYRARGNRILNNLKKGQYAKMDIFRDFAPLSHEDKADLILLTNKHILYLEKSRFSGGYDVEWEIELQSIAGIPLLLIGEKKLVICLKDNTGSLFSGNSVEITSLDTDILSWIKYKIEKALACLTYY